jgi:phage terminase large subunit-like protein
MRAGPKPGVDGSGLSFRTRKVGAKRFEAFCQRFIVVPKGHGARKPLRLRPWQIDLIGSVLDPTPLPRLAGWMLSRGQGKTTLNAALGLYDLMLGAEGASVVVAACDERQAGLCFNIARRMVELHPELESRVQVYQDRLVVPARDASFQVLPAVPKRLEGLDFTLAILDEFGRIDREVYEVVGLASGKRESSVVIGIGTPGPDWATSVLADMREYAIEHPDDPSLVWREFSAAGFEDHPVDCRHCWELASPALGDFLSVDGIAAFLPPKTRESTFRRSRLCQFSDEVDDPWLPPRSWEACTDDRPVPDGVDVTLALDGSFSQDATALVVCQIGDTPHLDVAGLWEPPPGRVDWRTPILDVEQAIRDACRRWQVRAIVCDPFRWQRSMQVLLDDGLPVEEFAQTAQRMTPATNALYEGIVNRTVTHSGDPRLARHVANATVRTDSRGTRVYKESKHSTRRIDLAVCAIMAHAAAQSVAPGPQLWVFDEAEASDRAIPVAADWV